MSSYSQQIAETIPEFFFIWSLKEKKIIYQTNDDLRFDKKHSEMDYFSLIRKLIVPEQQEKFDRMFNDINSGRFYQDVDFRSSNPVRPEYIGIKTFPIRVNGNGEVARIAGHVTDTTSRIEKEKSLREQNQKIIDILHILAHELKRPLTNINNFIQLQKTAENLQSALESSAVIERISLETTRLINSMIELIELESNEIKLNTEKIDLRVLIESAVYPYRKEIQDRRIKLNLDFADQPVSVWIDRVKFKLVVQNLISNSIKFTKDGGWIKIKFVKQRKKVIIIFEDNGIGISRERMSTLFDKFSKSRREGIRGEKSTGLGLAITKKIIELHGGQIEANSKEGQGSVFTIHIPSKMKDVSELKPA